MKTVTVIFLFFIFSFAFAQPTEELAREASEKVDNGDFKAALKLYNKLLEVDPENAKWLDERAYVNLQLENYQEAMDDFNEAIKVNPKASMLYNHRGVMFDAMQRPELAIKDYNTGLRYVGENDSLKYAILNNRGNAKKMRRDFEGAYQDYKAVLEFDSTSVTALTNMGGVLDDLGKDQEAIAYLEKVVALYPDFAGGYGNLAFRYMDLGNYEKALELNNKVLEIDENQPLAYNNRGYVKYKMGNFKEALQDVNTSLKLFPSNSFAYKNRALIYLALKKEKQACNDIDRALELGFTPRYGDEVEKLQREHCN